MTKSGRIAFGRMEEVIYGRAAATVIAEIAQRAEATRVFLMASSTLNTTTDEIAKVRHEVRHEVRHALANRCAGT